MPTILNQKQVGGIGFETITLELDSLRQKAKSIEDAQVKATDDIHKKVGHFYGQVENETDLFLVNLPNDAQVFVKAKKQYYVKTVLGWAPILGGGTGTGGGGSGDGVDYTQIMKLGVTAPTTFGIAVPYTADLSRPPLEVLKLTSGDTTTTTDLTFANTEADDFDHNEKMIKFDGALRLRNSNTTPMVLSQPGIFRSTVKQSDYKLIDSIEVK